MKLLEVIEQKSKKKTILESVPENLRRAEGIAQVADNRWLLVVDDGKSVYGFADETAANTALDEFNRPGVDRNDFDNRYQENRRTSRFNRATDAVDQAEFDARVASSGRSSWIRTIVANPLFRAMNNILRIAGPISSVYFGVIWAAQEVYDDPDLTQEEKQEQIGILYGLLVTEIIAILVLILVKARLAKRFIAAMRVFTRALSIGVAATGVGVIPGIIGFIVSEAAWYAVALFLTNTKVQRSLAEWLAGTFVGWMFGYVGSSVQAAAAALDSATNGAVGSRDLKRWLGFPPTDGDQILQSAPYGSSEWAKLVMGALMSGSGGSILVPYISPNKREALLAEALNMNIQELENTNAEETTAQQSSGPDDGSRNGQEPNRQPSAAPTGITPAARTREQSLQNNYSNPNFTRAQPVTGPR